MKKLAMLLAAAGAGALGLFVWGGTANAKSGLPPGWTPPQGAVFTKSTSNPTGLQLNVWTWRDSGNLGMTLLVTSAKNPQTDFAAFFKPDAAGQQIGVLAQGTTPNSGLIAQAGAAGLLA